MNERARAVLSEIVDQYVELIGRFKDRPMCLREEDDFALEVRRLIAKASDAGISSADITCALIDDKRVSGLWCHEFVWVDVFLESWLARMRNDGACILPELRSIMR